ncbi:MAG: thiamine pyrophosphate-binding protein [Anaerolineae bacterium]
MVETNVVVEEPSSAPAFAGPERTAGQAVVEALVAEGVDMVFGLPGSHVLTIYDALRDVPQIKHITVKHENNAALMADMYGRLTGRPGICLVTAGPGATNSLSGVVQAYDAASPLIHVSGTVPTDSGVEEFHGVDVPDFLYKIFQDVTKWSVRVESVEDIPRVFAKAFALAVSDRPGPVHIEIPVDLLTDGPRAIPPYEPSPVEPLALAPDLAKEAAEMLRSAKEPLICIGYGLIRHNGSDELVQLAERLGAPVILTSYAQGVIPSDHPLYATHFSGWRKNPFSFRLMKEADVLLTVGLRAGTYFAETVRQHAPARHIFIGFDSEPNPLAGATISAVADNRLALRALLAELEDHHASADPQRLAEIDRYRSGLRRLLDRQLDVVSSRRPLHFGLAMRELAAQVERDAIIVGDVGSCEIWARSYLPYYSPTTYISPGHYGAMGFSVPGAIAAKLLYPDRQVIGVTGDGAFLMSCSDFVTAVQYGAKVKIIILNDSAYGMINVLQNWRFDRTYATELGERNYAKLADSLGAVGIRVEDAGDMAEALRQALSVDAPAIVDVVAGWDYPYPDYERMVAEIDQG